MEQEQISMEDEQALRTELAGELWEGAERQPDPEYVDQQEQAGQVDESGPEPAPDVKSMLDSFLADIDKRLRPLEGRVGSIQRDIQLQKNAAEQAAKQVDEAPSKEQMASASKDAEEWQVLLEDFPEWADALEKKTAGLRNELKREIDALKSSVDIDERLNTMSMSYEIKLLSLKHPDWKEKTASAEYHNWLMQQPDAIRDRALNSNDAMECISILDQYDVSNKQGKTAAEIAEERKLRLKRSETLPGGKVPLKTKSMDDMSPNELRQHLAKEIWST